MSSLRPAGGGRLTQVRYGSRGSGTLLSVAVMAVLLVVVAMALCVAAYLVAVHRARAAADLAALAGAVAVQSGGDPCHAAGRIAAANGAELGRCRRHGDLTDYVVAVSVTVGVPVRVAGLPERVTAQADAGSVPP